MLYKILINLKILCALNVFTFFINYNDHIICVHIIHMWTFNIITSRVINNIQYFIQCSAANGRVGVERDRIRANTPIQQYRGLRLPILEMTGEV